MEEKPADGRKPALGRLTLYVVEGIFGLGVAVLMGSVLYSLLSARRLEHTALMFIGVPAVLAVAAALLPRPATAKGAIVRAITVALLLSSVLFGEGFVCIVMAAPLFYAVGLLIGFFIDAISNERRQPPAAPSCLLLLAIVPCGLEGVVPGFELARNTSVTVERVVQASPAQVEATLAGRQRVDRVLPAFFRRLRFPTPGATSGEGLQPGDRRTIEFLHNAHNAGHHPGILSVEVRERGPQHVLFAAVADTSYLTHWLSWQYADVTWQEAAPGQTRVTWTLAYRRRLDPAWYFAPLERYGVRLAGEYLIDTLATPHGGEDPQATALTPEAAREATGAHAFHSDAVAAASAGRNGEQPSNQPASKRP